MGKNIVFSAKSTTVILNLNGTNLIVSDLSDGENVIITPLNDNATATYGNDSVNIQKRADAEICTITFKVVKNGDSDRLINSFLYSEQQDAIDGTIKRMYLSNGQQMQETHVIKGGFIKTKPTRNSNNLESSIEAEYIIQAYVTTTI